MNWLKQYAVAVLYVTFVLSFLIMVVVIAVFCYFWAISSVIAEDDGQRTAHSDYLTEYPITLLSFFGAANALVVFRVFNLNILTILFHAIIFVLILVAQLLHVFLVEKEDSRDFTKIFQFPTFFLISLYILQIILALHLVVFRPGRTMRQREIRSGIHAFIGLITFFVQLWNVIIHLSMLCANPKHNRSPDEAITYNELLIEPSIMAAFMLIYVLLILFILLTPYFETEIIRENNSKRDSTQDEPNELRRHNSPPPKRKSKERRRSSGSKPSHTQK